MLDIVKSVFREERVVGHLREGVFVVRVDEVERGMELAGGVLERVVSEKTVLYLSGGRTPRDLYTRLAKEESLLPASVGLIDERYGEPFHANSNELMIRETGFLRYLQMRDIPFRSMLRAGKSREEVAVEYDGWVRLMYAIWPRSVGVLGIGLDGHTAGIPAGIFNSQFSIFNKNRSDLVVEYNDVSGRYGERVTMNFLGLAMLDLMVVLVFGEDKKEALPMVFSEGSEEEVPGRFYKREEIARRTVLITDQEWQE